MKNLGWFTRFTFWLMAVALKVRYRVTIKGLKELTPEVLNRPGGILFLPNHPTVFADPTLITLAILQKFPVRPLIVEYMFHMPIVNWAMREIRALPVPNFVLSSNSLKKKRAEKVVETVIKDLKKGDSFLIYPAGKVKHTAREIVAGSAVHEIIQQAPEANVVLVRITGLWGSSFSRALTGSTPYMFKTIWHSVLIALKSLIFFVPKREVTIEFTPAGPNFPYKASRLEMNRYFENWYNRPDGLSETKEAEPGETLKLVSYSMWREELPTITAKATDEATVELNKIPADIQKKVLEKLAQMTDQPLSKISPEMSLSSDLGMDSLDNAELITFLDDQFEVSGVPVGELTTVSKLMGLAAKQVTFAPQEEEQLHDISKWYKPIKDSKVGIAPGETIPEAFLNQCALKGHAVMCGDMRSGVITYSQAKMRVLLLADYISNLPGTYIGVLLPSSVAAYLTIIACQLAGKVPLMVNWTVGSRHLESVAAISKVQVVLSSWAFLDRLDNVDLNGIEELIVTLEDAKHEFKYTDMLKAYWRSKQKTKALIGLFAEKPLKSEDQAVLLFTSGTEGMPKGVPLSHRNILSNQREVMDTLEVSPADILLGILPPFHSFGFTLSGLLPLLAGFRVAYFPNPTDGAGLAKAVATWRATIICGAPTFISGMFKLAQAGQLDTLRLCVTGAEKTPPELYRLASAYPKLHLCEGYGITECSPVLTVNLEGDSKKGVGHPLTGVELCVVTIETHQPLPQGQQGLVLAKGPNIFAGYLNPGLNSPFLTVSGQQWYSTGDLGYLDKEGNLILSGRLKRFIKIGAEMISLTAIEDALQQKMLNHNAQNDEGPALAICAQEEAGEKPKITLFTRIATSTEDANKALKEAGFSNLVKVTKVEQIAEIPIMGSGKINYRALEATLKG